MTGRFTQLGRQLRKLRHIVGGSPSAAPVTTLRRATQLACDLACEQAAVDDAQAAFHDLAVRGILEPALAERLAAWVASHATDVSRAPAQRDDAVGERAMPIGRDLDTFLRSLELGAPAPEIPFEAIVTREPVDGAKPDSTAAVPLSGRIVQLEVRGGLAVITVDEQPIAMTLAAGELVTSFALAAAPTSRPEVHRERTGVTRVVWGPENLAIELAPDFTRVQVAKDPGSGHTK